MFGESIKEPVQLSEWQIQREWNGISPEFVSEKAVGRFEKLISREQFEAIFPNRMGTSNWMKKYGGTVITDYYSYDNLKDAISELCRYKCRIEMRENTPSVFRVLRLDKIEKTQVLVFEANEFYDDLNCDLNIVSKIVDYGEFLYALTEKDVIRELSAFLAMICCANFDRRNERVDIIEESDVHSISWGFTTNEQVGYSKEVVDSKYVKKNDPHFPPMKNKSYHGRGPVSLSYNYNYGYFSAIISGDKNALLKNPERITENGKLGYQTALLFWMTPKTTNMTSCHEVITNVWSPSKKDIMSGRKEACFGMVIAMVIGSFAIDLPEDSSIILVNVITYKRLLSIFGQKVVDEKCDTLGYI